MWVGSWDEWFHIITSDIIFKLRFFTSSIGFFKILSTAMWASACSNTDFWMGRCQPLRCFGKPPFILSSSSSLGSVNQGRSKVTLAIGHSLYYTAFAKLMSQDLPTSWMNYLGQASFLAVVGPVATPMFHAGYPGRSCSSHCQLSPAPQFASFRGWKESHVFLWSTHATWNCGIVPSLWAIAGFPMQAIAQNHDSGWPFHQSTIQRSNLNPIRLLWLYCRAADII